MTFDIDTIEVASALRHEPSSMMEVLAEFAEADDRFDDKLITWIAEANSGSIYHERVAPWLRRLADALTPA